MNDTHLAALTLEVWRASGARTERRRELLLMSYAEAYWGPAIHWPEHHRAQVDAARRIMRQRTRIDEIAYEVPA